MPVVFLSGIPRPSSVTVRCAFCKITRIHGVRELTLGVVGVQNGAHTLALPPCPKCSVVEWVAASTSEPPPDLEGTSHAAIWRTTWSLVQALRPSSGGKR
jgi:hypothetical protein